jgi:hypothetical protein
MKRHFQSMPGEILEDPAVSASLVNDWYNRRMLMLTYSSVASLVRFLNRPTRIYVFEAGQAAGFDFLVQHVVGSPGGRWVENINVWFHGSCDRPFGSECSEVAWRKDRKVRMFVRNLIEYDLLIASGFDGESIYHSDIDPVRLHHLASARGVEMAGDEETRYVQVIRKYGLRRYSKKILILSAGGGWLCCGVNLRAALDALHAFVSRAASRQGIDVIIKCHPRGDFYSVYALWAAQIPSLRVVVRRENATQVPEQYRKHCICTENALDELIGICDLVVSGPIFNSGVLNAARCKKPILFPLVGVFGNEFIVGTARKYFACADNVHEMNRWLEESLGTGRGPGGGTCADLYSLSQVKRHEFAAQTGSRSY